MNVNELKIAFLYNVRHIYPDEDNPGSFMEADYDDKETIDWMIKHLNNVAAEVNPIEANEEAYEKLMKLKGKINLVFNYSEGLHGKDRYSHLPSMLEMLQLPYTGSRPLTESLIMNKTKAKDIFLLKKIPTLPCQQIMDMNFELDSKLSYPLIVKPVDMGSSAGISNDSVINNKEQLLNKIDSLLKIFKNGLFLEPYLEGREFSIGMLGNPPKILPIIEADHSKLPKKYKPIDSLEVKWLYEEESEENHLVCPANIASNFKNKLHEICLEVWESLEIYDYCRIDLRCDKNMNPFVLEVNSPCGLIPPEVSKTSYFPLAARVSGIEYNELLSSIIKASLMRYNINLE